MARWSRSYVSKSDPIRVDINADNLIERFIVLTPGKSGTWFKEVMQSTLGRLVTIARSSARQEGLDRTDIGSKNGWSWQRKGRIPTSIAAGKVWVSRKDGTLRGRLFSFKRIGGAGKPKATTRAYHTNPLVAGYRQFVPTGKPGKGNVRFTKMQPPRPIFDSAKAQASSLFVVQITKAINKALRPKR